MLSDSSVTVDPIFKQTRCAVSSLLIGVRSSLSVLGGESGKDVVETPEVIIGGIILS
jgi:hypothetical protein